MFVGGTINSSTTEDIFTMSYTVTGGFAPTYRSIFYNSTGNEVSEVIGYPMRSLRNFSQRVFNDGLKDAGNTVRIVGL